MIGMTKPLRRFRATRAAEDGELTDSDGEEEEGQIKHEKGDDVALVAHSGRFAPYNTEIFGSFRIITVTFLSVKRSGCQSSCLRLICCAQESKRECLQNRKRSVGWHLWVVGAVL